ncbi:MAG: hypothetical protein NZM12_06120 [Steroidobacteraceae bacterium]|nr:hypothetical protein [Steroidobacteraceae bacterium]MDW8259942.1 FimV/HubP family polar landmark protein [Gammaproteobacteria bacterium]
MALKSLFLVSFFRVIRWLARGVAMGPKRTVWALCLWLVFPSGALALGLGDIRLNSALNQTLDAEIELINATPDELAGLKAQLASRETFARYGLEYPSFLNSVSLTRTRSASGKDVLRVRSTETITEPFVNLLVEVTWGRGRLVREYTVLLDPPVYAPNAPPPSVAVPATASPTAGAIVRPAPQATGTSDTSPQSTAGAGDTYVVARGDTLSSIAARVADGASRDQMMLALFRANPDAFGGNMNELRAGAILRLPSNAEAAAISLAEARSEIQRQYSLWRGGAGAAAAGEVGGGRLRLVAPSDAPADSGGRSAAANEEIRTLRERLAQIEGELAESRRLLELKNAELAELQRRLAQAAQSGAAAAPVVTPPTEMPADSVAATRPSVDTAALPAESAAPSEPAATPADGASAPQASAAVADAAPAEPAAATEPPMRPRVRPTVERASPQRSWLDALIDNAVPIIGVLLALAAGFFGWRKWKASREEVIAPRYPVQELQTSPPAAVARATEPQEAPMVVEESGPHVRPAFTASRPATAPSVDGEPSVTLSGDTAVNLDQADPMAEADFHMAYGLYDQAADLIRGAIKREPQRLDLKLKLVEVFFVWGNKDEFLRLAREIHASGIAQGSADWEKIVIMGRQIAPEEPLFATTGDTRRVAFEGVDLDLAAGNNAVDFDPIGGKTGLESVPDLDLSTQEVPAGAGLAGDADLLDLGALEDAPVAADRSGNTTQQMAPDLAAAAEMTEVNLAAGIGDAPTVEQPQLKPVDPTVRQKVEVARRQKPTVDFGIESTAEVAIDDLGIDVGDFKDLDVPDRPDTDATSIRRVAADTPTLVAGLDEESRRMIAEAADKADTAATASLAALDGVGIDEIELTDRTAEQPAVRPNGQAAPEFDVSAATGYHRAPSVNAETLISDDLTLPPLEPVTMSEVGTKLDLARAYIDMGDPDGARNILAEVLNEGSAAQKQEAQRLIDSLPG